jgi:hypothetical protein
MMHYTTQDFEKLCLILQGYKTGSSQRSHNDPVLKVDDFVMWEALNYFNMTIKGVPVGIKRSDLSKVVFCKKLIYKHSIPYQFVTLVESRYPGKYLSELHLTRSLLTFIRKIPLMRVPLYINSFPELSKWRMSIGK